MLLLLLLMKKKIAPLITAWKTPCLIKDADRLMSHRIYLIAQM